MATTTATYAFTKPAQGDTPWTTQINGDFDSIDAEIARPRLPFNSPTVGATTTCDLSLARAFVFTVSQATTLAFTNVPSSSFFVRIACLITNGAAFTLTWPASVAWLTGGTPLFQVAGVDAVELITKDGGTTWYARPLHGGYARLGAAANTAHVSQTLFSAGSLTTTSTSEVSLATYSLPGGALNIDGRQLRITVMGGPVTNNGTIRVKFGATYVVNTAGVPNSAAGQGFTTLCSIRRTGAATQRASAMTIGGSSSFIICEQQINPAETLANPITIDIRGNIITSGTLAVDSILIEALGV